MQTACLMGLAENLRKIAFSLSIEVAWLEFPLYSVSLGGKQPSTFVFLLPLMANDDDKAAGQTDILGIGEYSF